MAYKISDYLQMLLNLLPRGRAWSRSPDSMMYKLLHGHAVELNRLDQLSDTLKTERRASVSDALLSEHERDLGLPDECTFDAQTIAQRRSAAHAKIVDEGGLHQQSYIDLIADLGWTISITTFEPFICGVSECNDEIGDSNNIFYWQVEVDMGTQNIIYFECGSSECGDLLMDIGSTTPLVCFLNRYKPAHTQILYKFTGVEYDASFSSAFDAIPADSVAYLQGAFSKSFDDSFDRYLGDTLFVYDDTILEDDLILEDDTLMGG